MRDAFMPGDIVIFDASEVHESSIRFGSNTDPSGILEDGHEYIVQTVELHSWNTKLWLDDIEGRFNSVWFHKKQEA